MVRAASVLTRLLQGEEAGGEQVQRGRTTGMEVREGLAPQSGTVTSVPAAPGSCLMPTCLCCDSPSPPFSGESARILPTAPWLRVSAALL